MSDQAELSVSKTLGEDVYRRLRSDLLSGRLKPGQRLPFRNLSATYSVGIAPLREAMSRLASEQLVDFEGQRGFTVAAVEAGDLLELAKLRVQLYVDALERAIRRGDDAWECEMLVAFHMLEKCPRPKNDGSDGDYDEWERRHERFHNSLISACGSRWLIKFCQTLSEQYGRYRRYVTLEMSASEAYWTRVQADHKKLLDQTLARNVEAAVEAAREHLEANIQQLLALYDERSLGEASAPPGAKKAVKGAAPKRAAKMPA
ncbi:GntR family transcriptional regulator [Bosea caraganae]|uniref:GntR family transcriptional regulator n=1 Tax=Bosea caraganae TaxID=2763117 RepID=UPI0011C07B4B|nr:GntR family transcriptional regulator [Bosea caraganae]